MQASSRVNLLWRSACASSGSESSASGSDSHISNDGEGRESMKPALKPSSAARVVQLARENCTAKEWGKWLRTPFERAAAEGDEELVLELAEAGAVGDPFAAAIRADQHGFLDHLIPVKKDIPARYLRLAVTLGKEPIVSLLLDRGADPEGGDGDNMAEHEDSWTPLHVAAKSGHAGIVGLLLDAGASAFSRLGRENFASESEVDTYDSEESDMHGIVEAESALDLAAQRGHVDVIKAITQRAPSLVHKVEQASGYTALHNAAQHSQIGSMP